MAGRLPVRRPERQVELHRDHGPSDAYTDHAGPVGHKIPATIGPLEGLQGKTPPKFPSNYYGISGPEEARAYLEDAVLGTRLREVTAAVLSHPSADIAEVMGGGLDATKLRSSMTLFDAASPDDIFAQVLDTFYGGQRDPMTLGLLKGE